MQLLAPIALIQQDLGICLDRVPAPEPLGPSGPMALDHLMTTGIQNADLILLQALLMNMREVPSYYDFIVNSTILELRNGWINTLWEESNMPADNRSVTIHCKAGSISVRLVFESRAKCEDFVVRYNDDGFPYEIDSPFCRVKTTVTVRQSKSIEIGKQFAPLWRVV